MCPNCESLNPFSRSFKSHDHLNLIFRCGLGCDLYKSSKSRLSKGTVLVVGATWPRTKRSLPTIFHHGFSLGTERGRSSYCYSCCSHGLVQFEMCQSHVSRTQALIDHQMLIPHHCSRCLVQHEMCAHKP